MSYLIKLFFFILIFLSNIVFASDNKIIFKVNEEIYTSIDFKNRIKYLEILNSRKFESEMNMELINDYFNSIIFYEYVKNNTYLNNILEKESKKIFDQIVLSNDKLKNNLNEQIIKNNINYDFARKIVLENILDGYKEYIFSNSKDINLIYNYILKYITIPIDNLFENNEFKKVLNSQNYDQLSKYIIKNKIEYHSENIEIKNLDKINKNIKNLLNSNNKFLFEKNNNFYRISIIEKKLDVSNGVYYRLINIETDKILKKKNESCNYIKKLKNIKSSKEYQYNKLNDNIKINLISINDFIIFQNNNFYNYIFLCEIRVNEDFLKEININKKINFLATNIELDFINKYSKIYKIKKYYE